ncbi:MAG: cytochrome c biogenesis protein CcsA [Bacteroidaceae bacterium]
MNWSYFTTFAVISSILWITGALIAWKKRNVQIAGIFTGLGLLVFFTFIIGLWISYKQPPMRTMGETRLWYSFFLSLVGLLTYIRWHYKWLLGFSTTMSIVFITINILKPEIHNRTLMPALQSPWFAPHVTVYMFAYALLGAATLVTIYLLWFNHSKDKDKKMLMCDNLVQFGVSFLTLGLLSGAVWAKGAWGHYWSWDPKETWAAITWFTYLFYIHYRLIHPKEYRFALYILLLAFILLQVCWWGINFLPSARGISVHSYG